MERRKKGREEECLNVCALQWKKEKRGMERQQTESINSFFLPQYFLGRVEAPAAAAAQLQREDVTHVTLAASV